MTTLELKRVTVHTCGPWSVTAQVPNQTLSGAASAVWTAANRAIYVPFWLPVRLLVTQLFSWTGATASGNIDVGLYSASGAKLVSSGSTAQSASVNVLQAFNIADIALAPGTYYFAVAMDNTTGTVFRINPNANIQRGTGMFLQETAFPLPTAATFASFGTVNYIPIVGLTTRSFL